MIAIFLLLNIIFIILEFVEIFIISDQEYSIGYKFGSESMVGVGGWKYESVQQYGLYILLSGVLSIINLVFVVRSLIRHEIKDEVLTFFLLFFLLVIIYI